MTTLLTIPGATAYHLPAPGITPVALSEGDLTLALVPAFPPSRPTESVTITVGASTFVLTKNAPVQRTNSKNEHPSIVFTPAPLADGRPVGQVRVDFRDSRNADEWEATEQAYNALQAELKSYGLWEDKILFVDDEYETGTIDTSPKLGWGEAITSNLSWAASKLFGRKPEEPGLPTSVQAPAPGVHSTLGPAPHPKPAAEFNKSSDSSQPQAVPSGPGEQKEFRGLASHSWTQASIAAQGIGAAAMAVGNRDAVDGLGSPTKSAQNPYAAPNTYSSSNPYGSPTKAMLYESSPKRQSPAPATVQPQGETESSGEKKSAGTENKVSEVSEKIAAVKIDSDSQDVQDVEVKDEVKEVKPVKPVEEENAEAAFEAKKEEIKEAVAEAKAIEEEKKAVTEDKDITAAKKDEFDDVDLLDDAPATPATAETTETETDDKEEEDTADIADAPATATATETKAAPKKKNKKKGKKGKN